MNGQRAPKKRKKTKGTGVNVVRRNVKVKVGGSRGSGGGEKTEGGCGKARGKVEIRGEETENGKIGGRCLVGSPTLKESEEDPPN